MTAIVSKIYSYPVKGLSGTILAHTELEVGQTIEGDRRFALGRPGFYFDLDNPVWMPKTNFLALVRDEKLAELDANYDDTTGTLTLQYDGRVMLDADLSTLDGRTSVENFFTQFLTAEIDGKPTLLEAKDHSFSDLDTKVISLISLDSVRDLASFIGADVDPRRFRGNLYLAGLPAWEEFDWVSQKVRIGEAVLEVIKRTRRCAATNVNPETALRDMNLPKALQKGWGHTDLGIYARVIASGEIHLNDTVTLID